MHSLVDKITINVELPPKELALLNVLVDTDLRDEEASIACARADESGSAIENIVSLDILSCYAISQAAHEYVSTSGTAGMPSLGIISYSASARRTKS